jgi:hypothetical protein
MFGPALMDENKRILFIELSSWMRKWTYEDSQTPKETQTPLSRGQVTRPASQIFVVWQVIIAIGS